MLDIDAYQLPPFYSGCLKRGLLLGVPYEFHPASAIPPRELIDMTPPARFRRAHASVKPGTWSDDGALALCLLDSLIEKDGLDLANLASKFLDWGSNGYLAVDGRVFDIGIQTRRAFENLKDGMSPETAGPSDVRSNGNGSLMRALPLALWHSGTLAQRKRRRPCQSGSCPVLADPWSRALPGVLCPVCPGSEALA